MTGYVLDVVGANNVPCALLQMYPINNTNAQKWRLTSDMYLESGLRTSEGRDLVLEVVSGGAGASLQLNVKNNGSLQKWSWSANGLMSYYTGLVLEIRGANSSVGASLWMNNVTYAIHHAWNFRYTDAPVFPAIGQ